MTKKIIDNFKGKLFMPNPDVLTESLRSLSEPDESYTELKKIKLIFDQENNNRYLVGDFDGDAESHGYVIKVFLYSMVKPWVA